MKRKYRIYRDGGEEYELLQAVFQCSRFGDPELQSVCVVKYIRLIAPASRGYALQVLKKDLERRYTKVKFWFWAQTWTASGGQPTEIELPQELK